MEERKTIALKKEEFEVREYIKNYLGKGKVSKVSVEYTPVGEKIIVSTHKPGLVIGRKGERIEEMTEILKKKFGKENPHIEIEEVKEPEFDAQIMADDIALALERFGPLKFKVIAYRTLQKIIDAGALGVEIRLNGKLPSSRAKNWVFSQGYLKKTGDPAKLVSKAQSRAETKPGTVGVKVSILSPHVIMKDKINVDEQLIARLKESFENVPKKKTSKKSVSKNVSEESK
jgi:small subunit ribosomal protein S3